MEHSILCDSSVLISLTDACFADIFPFLAKKTPVEFYITPGVKQEIINRPLSIQMKAYELSAVRMKKLLKDKAIKYIDADTADLTKRLMFLGNNMFYAHGKPIHLIDLGETDIIATASLLGIKALLIDERTTRMLIEAPFRVKDHLEDELRTSVSINEKNYYEFRHAVEGMKVIRSIELLSVAYELGYFDDFGNDKVLTFEAALYKTKYSGSAVQFDEIKELLHILTQSN